MPQSVTEATPRENVRGPQLRGWRVLSCCVALLLFLGSGEFSAQDAPTDHLERAVALVTQGDLEGAEKEANLALKQPSTRAAGLSVLGTIRLQQNRIGEGREFLEEALKLNPDLLGARLNLGHVYVLEGRADQAREMFQVALKADPGSFNARVSLAQLEADTGNYAASVEIAQPVAATLRSAPEGLHLLATGYLGLGQKEMARSLLAAWMPLSRIPEKLAVSFAQLLLTHHLEPEAVQVLEKAKSEAPASFQIAWSLGESYLLMGDLGKAEENYEQASSISSDCVPCYRQIASIARRQGDTEKALAYLIKAKRLDPENPDVLFEFGRVCLERDLFRDALPALEQAAELRPDNDRFTYVLASAYIGKVRYKEAITLLDRLVKKNPEDPVLNYALGSVLCTEGKNYPDAEKYLRKSISLQPDQLGAYYYLGLVLLRTGGQDQAAEIFQGVLKNHPDHIPSMEQLSIILVRKRKYDEAHQILDKVLRLDPDSLTGHYQVSLLLGRLGQKEDADRHMQIAQRLEAEAKEKQKTELYLLTPH